MIPITFDLYIWIHISESRKKEIQKNQNFQIFKFQYLTKDKAGQMRRDKFSDFFQN